jgi:hypothetical protein
VQEAEALGLVVADSDRDVFSVDTCDRYAAAPSEIAVEHFQEMLGFETLLGRTREPEIIYPPARARSAAAKRRTSGSASEWGEKDVAKPQAQWPRLALCWGAFSSCGSLAMFATGLLLHSADPNVADIRPTPA